MRTDVESDQQTLARQQQSVREEVEKAGGKVVAAFNPFSNPYVDWDARAQDRNRLFAALDAAEDAEFATLADRYGVRFVVARDKRAAAYAARSGGPVVLAFAAGDIRIFRRRP